MLLIKLLGAGTAAALSTVLLQGLAASARVSCDSPSGSISTNMNSVNTGLNCPGKPGQNNQRPDGKNSKSVSRGKPACVWVPKPDYQAPPGAPVEGKGGHWYQKFCSFGQYKTLADLQRVLDSFDVTNIRQIELIRRAGLEIRFFKTPPRPPRRTPEQVMQSVVDSLPFPATFVAVSPAASKQVVGIPTWVWLTDAQGRFVPARYGQKTKAILLEGYALQWSIVPQVSLTPGDGGPGQTCVGAGVPWSASAEDDPAACKVTYEKSGAYSLTASVGWTVQWWLAGARQPDISGPVKTATRPLNVGEIQTVTR